MKQHGQSNSISIHPDGSIELIAAEENAREKSPLPTKMDEVIALDFSKYWGACTNKRMNIRTILFAQSRGAEIEKLPEWVRRKVAEAVEEEAALKEDLNAYFQGRIGNEEVDISGRNYFTLVKHHSGPPGTRLERKIFALSDEEAGRLQCMGTAEGQYFSHCVYLPLKYSPYFFERVCGYQIVNPEKPEMKLAVNFYEQKPN
jgi:hypothetical protein